MSGGASLLRRRLLGLALLAMIGLLPLLALGVTVVRYMEFQAAMDGEGGTAGTAVVEEFHTRRTGGDHCAGVFLPDDGSPPIEVDIEVYGDCEVGMRLRAVLVEPATFHPDWWGRPTAWVGRMGYGEHILPIVLVLLLFVLPVWAAFWFTRKSLWRGVKRMFERPGPPVS